MPTAVYAPPAKAIIHFARALGAARSGDLATAQVDIDKLSELKAALEGTNQPHWVGQVEVQILAAQAWLLHGRGDRAEASRLMQAAASLKDGSEKHVASDCIQCASCSPTSRWNKGRRLQRLTSTKRR